MHPRTQRERLYHEVRDHSRRGREWTHLIQLSLLISQQRLHAITFFSRHLDHILEQAIRDLDEGVNLKRAEIRETLHQIYQVMKKKLSMAGERASLHMAKFWASQHEMDDKFVQKYDLKSPTPPVLSNSSPPSFLMRILLTLSGTSTFFRNPPISRPSVPMPLLGFLPLLDFPVPLAPPYNDWTCFCYITLKNPTGKSDHHSDLLGRPAKHPLPAPDGLKECWTSGGEGRWERMGVGVLV